MIPEQLMRVWARHRRISEAERLRLLVEAARVRTREALRVMAMT